VHPNVDLSGRLALVAVSARGIGRAIAPGFVRTDAASHVTGHVLVVDGGLTAAL